MDYFKVELGVRDILVGIRMLLILSVADKIPTNKFLCLLLFEGIFLPYQFL